ncbi:DUF6463 family protein [Thermoactinospora rubra]|uniref:DUF6463 family protein n=1 Tax=Thermoactinospora rubra TaxID=1088767 RepID=UPI0011814A37|nr:DUF6463 family protein [Thermoactinospora rubra]
MVDTSAADYFARESSVWFMVSGVVLLALGTLARHIIRTTGRLPAQVGWYLVAIGFALCLIYFPSPAAGRFSRSGCSASWPRAVPADRQGG